MSILYSILCDKKNKQVSILQLLHSHITRFLQTYPYPNRTTALSAGALEYADCTSADHLLAVGGDP